MSCSQPQRHNLILYVSTYWPLPRSLYLVAFTSWPLPRGLFLVASTSWPLPRGKPLLPLASPCCCVHGTAARRTRSASLYPLCRLSFTREETPTDAIEGSIDLHSHVVGWPHVAAFSTCASWSCFAATSKTVAEIPQRIFIAKNSCRSLNFRAQTQGFDLRLNSPQSHVAIDA